MYHSRTTHGSVCAYIQRRSGKTEELLHAGSERDWDFAAFFEGHYAAACRYATVLCGSRTEGEELAQQAFVRVYARWSKVRSETAEAYMRTTLTRLFLDTKRRGRAREKATEELPEVPVEAKHVVLERDLISAALGRLPKKQRAVVLLRFVYDLSVDEVAATLGCSSGTVRSQASRGLAALREAYDEQDAQEAPC